MKICVLTSAFPRWEGDHRAPFMLEMAKAVQAKGHTVRVVAMHNPGAKSQENMDGIEVIRPRYLPERWEVLQKEEGGMPVMWKKYPLLRLALIPYILVTMMAVIRYSADCDLIHANWTLAAMITWITGLFHRKPFIVTVHGSDIFQAGKSKIIAWFTCLVLNRSQRVIAVSTALAEASQKLGVDSKKIIIIPDGVNPAYFHPHQDILKEDLVMTVGALREVKGTHILIDAFSEVVRAFPTYRLILIGDGPLKNELRTQAKSLGVEEHVDFIGTLPPEQVALWLMRAKIFAMPSLSEGLGVVILEAMAAGLPCVGSRVGGIPDLIDEKTGILVSPSDSPALAKAIIMILQSPELQKQMGDHALERVLNEFDWKVIGFRLIEVYQSAVGTKIR